MQNKMPANIITDRINSGILNKLSHLYRCLLISTFIVVHVFGLSFANSYITELSSTTKQPEAQAISKHLLEESHHRQISEATSAISATQNKQNIKLTSDALVLATKSGSTTLASSFASSTASYDDNMGDDLCTLKTISRTTAVEKKEVVERVLSCSQVYESNYRHMVKTIYKRNKLNIQQIEITNSESNVVFSAIDLICDRYDCSKLTSFNITGHDLDVSKLNSWISSWPQLEVLDLSNTSLKAIESIFQVDMTKSLILSNLSTLVLDSNKIVELNFNFIFESIPNLRQLSLVNNSIHHIICSENLRSRLRSQMESISLAGNYINCEKSQLWFMKQFQNPNMNLKFPDYDKINCSLPIGLAEMNWNQRVSVLETQICDECECTLKRTAIYVDCHNKSLKALPDIVPITTKILNLTSNRIDSLAEPSNSKNWENVTYVHLKDNLISSFQPLEINSNFMRNLAALDIRKNKFQQFPIQIFEQFVNLDQVHLSDNPWLCDCESTFAFQGWLQRQFHKVRDKEDIKCGIAGSDENGVASHGSQQRLSNETIYRLSKSELCPQEGVRDPYDWLDFVNLFLSLAILLVLTKVTLDYIYQHRTKRLPHFFRLNF